MGASEGKADAVGRKRVALSASEEKCWLAGLTGVSRGKSKAKVVGHQDARAIDEYKTRLTIGT